MHGAGTAKRVKTGERKDPTTARLVHGVYATKSQGLLARATEELGDVDNAKLFSLPMMQKMLLATLTLSDKEETPPDPETTRRVVGQMVRNTVVWHKLTAVGKDAVPMPQVQGLLQAVFTFVQEVSMDASIPRDEILPEVLRRVREIQQRIAA